MKRCGHCKKYKPESEFHKCTCKKDGLSVICKKCASEKNSNWYKKKHHISIDSEENIIGGYKISILNHASRTEKKYNVASTDGNYYATNDKGEFFNYLRGIL